MSITRAYRKLAMALAFIMVCGTFAVGPGAENVYAARGDLTIEADSVIMMPPLNSSTPEVITRFSESNRNATRTIAELQPRLGDVNTQAVMWWSDIETDSQRNTYQLEYPLGDNLKAIFEVKKRDVGQLVFDVSYTLRRYSVADPAGMDVTIGTGRTNFEVYFGDNRYRSPNADNELSRQNATGDTIYLLDATIGQVPKFTINTTPEYAGFSFKFGERAPDRTIHFLYQNDTFFFATDGIDMGKIYEFKLTSYNAGGVQVGAPSIMSYYAYPLPTFLPYSHVDSSFAPAEGYSVTGSPSTQTNPYLVLEDRRLPETDAQVSGPPAQPGMRPGADKQQLQLRIPRALQWDDTKRQFVSAGGLTSGNPTRVQMSVELSNRLEIPQEAFVIDDVQRYPGDPSHVLNDSHYRRTLNDTIIDRVVPEAVDGVEYITVVLDDMAAGQMYGGSVKGSTAGSNVPVALRESFIEFGRAYTLLKYTLIDEFIEIWPYEGVTGTYVIGGRRNADFPFGSNSIFNLGMSDSYVITIAEKIFGTTASFTRPIPIHETLPTYYGIMFILDTNSSIRIPSQPSWGVKIPSTSLKTPTQLFAGASLEREYAWFTGEKGKLDIKLRWDLGRTGLVDDILDLHGGLNITYEVSKSSAPSEEVEAYKSFAQVELNITSGGALGVQAEVVSALAVTAGQTVSAAVDAEGIVVLRNPLTNSEHYYINLILTVEAHSTEYDHYISHLTGVTRSEFVYPGIYFVKVKPIERDGVATEGLSASPAASITINGIVTPEVPSPQTPRVQNIEQLSFDYEFSMPTDNIMQFLSFHAPEIPPEAVEWKLNLYISQSEASLNSQLYRDPTDNTSKLFHRLSPEGKVAENGANAAVAPYGGSVTTLNFSNSASLASPSAILTVKGGAQARDALRDGKIVWVKDIAPVAEANGNPALRQPFVLDGLDMNQKYYIYSEVVVRLTTGSGVELSSNDIVMNKPEEPGRLQGPVDRKELVYYSVVSELVSLTTKGRDTAPDPDEKNPVTPTEFNPRDIQDTSAILEWKGIGAAGETIEYEIIRIRNEQLDPSGELLSDKVSLKELWDKLPANHTLKIDAGGANSQNSNYFMRTDGSNSMLKWNPSSNTFSPADVSAYGYSVLDENGFTWYDDKTLAPNQIYFYYLRAVKIDSGGITYSNWVHTTLTTLPVKRPVNLRIEPQRPSPLNYDRETQTMISFEAEINPAVLPSEFTIWYEIKEEGKSWSSAVRMTESLLNQLATPVAGSPGTYKYYYRISGLTQGTSYTIRVYAQDADGNKSLYSNEATTKTDINQEEYDREKELEGWQQYLRNLLNQLLKNPYWALYDTTGRLELVYRPTMFNQLIVEAMDANINLQDGEGSRGVYYIPVSAFVAAENANKGFRIVHDNVEIIIPASVIDMNLNTRIIDMNSRVRTKEIADYYVMITVDRRNVRTVDSIDTATLETSIRLDVLEGRITADQWDKDMFNRLADDIEKKLKRENSDIYEELIEMIKDQEISEEIIKYLEGVAEDTIRDFSSTLRTQFNTATRSEFNVSLDRRYTVIGRNTTDKVVGNGYEYTSGMWVQRETTPYGAGQAMYPTAAGTFIFAGRPTSIPSLVGVQDGAAISALVYKYNLEDFLGSLSAHSVLDYNVTRDMVAGTVARIMGAPRGADSVAWLNQNRQLGLVTRNSHMPVETQEAVYLVMSLYSFKTNTPVANIQIRNFAVTNNMQGLEERYRQHVRAGFELGLLTDRNMSPTSHMRVREFLRLLVELDKRVKL